MSAHEPRTAAQSPGPPKARASRPAPGRVPTSLTQGSATRGGIGESTLRPDGILKVPASSRTPPTLWHEDMRCGATPLRSTLAHARIRSIDTGEALATPGVYAVLTYDDLPTEVRHYGLEIRDTPVARRRARSATHGEPVALVAADHPETARRAAAKIRVEYEETARRHRRVVGHRAGAALVHEHRDDHYSGHVPHPKRPAPPARRPRERRRRRRVGADVVVSGEYVFGMQDQAFIGPGVRARGAGRGRRRGPLRGHQWLHSDLRQIAPGAGPAGGQGPDDAVRRRRRVRRPRGPVHADPRLPAGAAHRQAGEDRLQPLRVPSSATVHRHPRQALVRAQVPTSDGKFGPTSRRRIVLDGGAYASSSPAVVGNAASLGVGPYVVDGTWTSRQLALYTNNPPCGAMRGFGAVQGMLRLRGPDGPGWPPNSAWTRWSSGRIIRHGAGAVMPTGQRGGLARAGRANCCAGSRPARCRRNGSGRPPKAPTYGRCPAACPTPNPPGEGRGPRGSATRSASRTSASPRASTTTPPRARTDGGPQRRTGGDRAHRDGRGRAGRRHHPRPDRPDRTRRRPGHHPARRHPGRLGRLHLRVPADVHDRRRGEEHLRGGTGTGCWRSAAANSARTPCVGHRRTACWRAARWSPTAVRRWPNWRTYWAGEAGRHRAGVPAPAHHEPFRPAQAGRATAMCRYSFAAHRAVVEVDTGTRPGQGGGAGLRPGCRQGRSTRCRWQGRSRAAAPRAWAWR